jgi:hypothetical protein
LYEKLQKEVFVDLFVLLEKLNQKEMHLGNQIQFILVKVMG